MADSNGSVLIGVDGGGSGCRAAVRLPGRSRRFEGVGESANFTTDPDGTIRNVKTAVLAACRAGGFDIAALKDGVAHVGLAGVMDGTHGARVAAALPFAVCEVTDDRPTAVAGALGGRDGFVIAAGTGSFVGRSVRGEAKFVGGWGLRLGDEASAAWVGRGILSRVLHCEDGLAEHSDLTTRILSEFGRGAAGIVRYAGSASPFDFGRHAPKVVTAALEGDANGLHVMRRGADYLAEALRVLEFSPGDRLCAMGGIGARFLDYMPADMTANTDEPAGTPLDGAMILANRLARRHGTEPA